MRRGGRGRRGRVLPFIHAAHAELGEALGLGETPLVAPDTTAVRDANVRLAKAIANYGRVMVGVVDVDDPKSIAAFKRAMYPLDAYRRANFSRGAGKETEVEVDEPVLDTDVSPTDPIPVVPTDPVV